MALNDLLTNAQSTPADPPASDWQPVALTTDAPAADDATGEYEEREDGSVVYADGYRIDADGRHFDAEGNELTEDPPTGEEPVTPVTAPVPAVTPPAEPRDPVPQVPQPIAQPSAPAQQLQQSVYNYQNCFNPQEQEQLAQLDVTEPMRAQQARFERWKRVDAYASDVFDAQVDALEREAPELVQKFSRQFDRAKRSMSVEQLQRPGIVNEIAARIVAGELASDPKKLQALVLGQAVVTAPPAQPAPAPRQPAPVIPPEQRMPKPRAVRRQAPARGGSGGGATSGLKLVMQLNPTMSVEEAREYVQGIHNAEKRRD